MKKMFLFFGMLSLSFLGFAQVSKQRAIETVMNLVVQRDSINIYMEPLIQSKVYYNLSRFDSISAPYSSYWLFFIDDNPEYGWGHDCRYVFVNQETGEVSIMNSQTPPWHYKVKFDIVSEPIGIGQYSINTNSLFDTGVIVQPVEGKYAVLFSGGEISGDSIIEFWNALCHSYCGLIENGFKKENIFVLSYNGNTTDSEGHVTNPYLDLDQDGSDDIRREECNVENLKAMFDSLAIIMEEGDFLYVYGTMHGFRSLIDTTSHGLWLWNQEPLYDTVFASMLSQIKCSQYIVNLWSCYSGGFVQEIFEIDNPAKKTVLTCCGSNFGVLRVVEFSKYSKMDVYNYFVNTALRYYHPNYIENFPWNRYRMIGQLADTTFFSLVSSEISQDINYDEDSLQGNANGISEFNEVINYTKYYDPGQFGSFGVKHYDCGFKDDLLSLHGITGKVVSIDSVSGSFHIEDSLSICADSLRMKKLAKFYLFDADLIIEDTASLVMKDSTAIIARSGNCRVIIKGGIRIGKDVVFEARDGSTLQIIFENDTDLDVSDAIFINCNLVLPERKVSFTNCHFIGTPFFAEITIDEILDDSVIVTNCDFVPNGKSLPEAICIRHYPYYLVQGCSVDASGEGSFSYGISIYNSGSKGVAGSQCVRNNTVKGCLNAGLLMYASYGDVRTNIIEGNGYGVKLFNNCNINQFTGNCRARTGAETQYIHDNDSYEVFMTANCIPETFRYNYIADDDNVPFVYHDASIGFGEGTGVDPRSNFDVTLNYWGSNFIPSTHLYTTLTLTGYDYLPYWTMGECANINKIAAALMLSEADSLSSIGEYASAKSVYMQVVGTYPSTISAETALKTLLVLEEHVGNNYSALKSYYQTNEAIASDDNLSHLASSLANKCDERMENYDEAIAWYEEVLTNPNTSFNDSIFAAIDLGDLYLRLDEGGEKGICGKMVQYKPKSVYMHNKQTNIALSMIPQKEAGEKDYSDSSPVQNLELSVGSNDTVLLTWDLPSGSETNPMALSWLMNDSINDCAQLGYDSYMSNRYDALDLRTLIGWRIESISYFKTTNWTQSLCVWKQKQDEEMIELYSQEVPENASIGLLTILLDEDIVIEPNTQYWFALRAKWNQGQPQDSYSFGLSVHESGIDGKSNLAMMSGSNEWQAFYHYNFWIRACLVDAGNGKRALQNSKEISPLTGYRIYRDGELIKEIPYSFVTYFTDTQFTKGIDVEYCVTTVYGDEESEPVCATANITGVAEKPENDGITVSPNPTNGMVLIEGVEVAEVQVYNDLGQKVKTVQNTNEIDMGPLPEGVYLLRIKATDGYVHTGKVAVSK